MAATAPTASSMADTRDGPLDAEDAKRVRERLNASRTDRRRRELFWQECLAFAAGKHHLRPVDRGGRRQLVLPDLPKGRLRYKIDELSRYRQTLLGEMLMDDDRPQVLFRQEDVQDEAVTEQANDAISFGWETEWLGDDALFDVRLYLIDLGTAAVRCRFDKTAGPLKQRVPTGRDGKAALDTETVQSIRDTGTLLDGSLPKFKSIHEGRIRWEAGGPFNFLTPPGVKREHDFPWECWVAAVPSSKLVEEFPDAAGVKADDLTDVMQLGAREVTGSDGVDADAAPARLRNHVLTFTYYERPSAKHGKGRVIVLAGEGMRVIDVRDQLDYVAPDGTYRSGIHYFHYNRLSDSFWSQGMVGPAMDPQRQINDVASAMSEIAKRSLPKVYESKGSITKVPVGLPLERIIIDPSKPKPIIDNGPGMPTWMESYKEGLREDLSRVTGVNDVSVGENPQGVGNYSQLALLREQDGRKLDPTIKTFKASVVHLVEDSLWDIRRYWPAEKQIAIAGPDGTLRAATFVKSTLPDSYKVLIPKGASKPRSQAAQLSMIDTIAQYAINSRQPLPVEWVLKSYEAGRPLELPEAATDDQLEKARFENGQLADAQLPTVDYFDNHVLHVQEHRSVQIQAKLAGRRDVFDLCEQHIQAHLAAAQQAAAQQAATQPPPVPPGAPFQPATAQPQIAPGAPPQLG